MLSKETPQQKSVAEDDVTMGLIIPLPSIFPLLFPICLDFHVHLSKMQMEHFVHHFSRSESVHIHRAPGRVIAEDEHRVSSVPEGPR